MSALELICKPLPLKIANFDCFSLSKGIQTEETCQGDMSAHT